MDLSFGPEEINACLNGSQFWTTAINVCLMDLSFGPEEINACLNGSQFWTTAY